MSSNCKGRGGGWVKALEDAEIASIFFDVLHNEDPDMISPTQLRSKEAGEYQLAYRLRGDVQKKWYF